jgi:hypothetical protein
MFKLEPEIGDVTIVGNTTILGKLVYRYRKWVNPPEITEEGGCPVCVDMERESGKVRARGMISKHKKYLILKGTIECECGNHLILYTLFPHPEGDVCFEVYKKYG